MKKRIYENDHGIFLTKKQTAETFNIGLSAVDSLAVRASAKIKIGRSVRYDREKIATFLRTECLAR